MNIEYIISQSDDGEILAELRVKAMRPSLEALGRFDPVVARRRFLDTFTPENTIKVCAEEALIGFYVIQLKDQYVSLDHLYIDPDYQGIGIGAEVLNKVKEIATKRSQPIKLGALRDSRSNAFYLNHGFVKTHEEEWDIYYQWQPS